MNSFTISMMMWPKPDGQKSLIEFKEKAAPLFEKYGIKVERVIACKNKGQIIGQNLWELPDILQIISAPSAEIFQNYLNDPEYIKLAPIRDQALERLIANMGPAINVQHFNSTSDSLLNDRFYGIGFANFLEGGRTGLLEFNLQALDLFKRHGMHVEFMFDGKMTKTIIGKPLIDYSPELIVVFFLDHQDAMKSYASDPEYQRLSPIRDSGLKIYNFFSGKCV